ncbi:MAG: hydantoinase B/oxoprolinase family protein [Chloroflexota bacterium]|nr:MAG: hydantoinase B/oxoprolinase family protein [Chloroflexota bacterium]
MIDPVTLSITWHRFESIAREIGAVMAATARSPIFSEAHDFSCFITDAAGIVVTQADGLPIHTGCGGTAVRSIIEQFGGNVSDGDVFIVNDPYLGGGNHLPDAVVATPVFHQGSLLFYACNRAHQTDIGGGAPGTYNPRATNIFQEGLRIPPTRLCRGGGIIDDVLGLIAANTRQPDVIRADIGAMIGSTAIGRRRLLDLADSLGGEGTRLYTRALLDAAERLMREELRRIPDGVYVGHDAMNNDCRSPRDVTVRVRIEARDGTLDVDFDGSDEQIPAYKNSSFANTLSAVYLAVALLVDTSIPRNEGAYRPIRVRAPLGSVVNPRAPAPVGSCTVHPAIEIMHACWRALTPALGNRASAGWGKEVRPITTSGPADAPRVVYHSFTAPGPGAAHGRDGFDNLASLVGQGGSYAPSVERWERQFPIRILQNEYRLDGAGAGQWRGGTGQIYEVLLHEDSLCSMRAEGTRTPSGFGVLGGGDGAPGMARAWLPGDEAPRDLPQNDIIDLPAGTRVRIDSPGGGGWGDPASRDPESTSADVRDGILSPARARRDYGRAEAT